jgi:hypothetical protein
MGIFRCISYVSKMYYVSLHDIDKTDYYFSNSVLKSLQKKIELRAYILILGKLKVLSQTLR